MRLVIREQQYGDGNGKSIYIENREFNHLLTQHDFHYCTDSPSTLDSSYRIITTEIRKFSNAESKKLHIVDIGCGQGELVRKLRSDGLSSIGFDPVLRENSPYLFARYFSPGVDINKGKVRNFYILRCVLPHIQDPFDFIENILSKDPSSVIYIEWQNLEKMIHSRSWYMFMHDHVNYFSASSFKKYSILSYGQFGEWDYIIISLAGEKNLGSVSEIVRVNPDSWESLLQQSLETLRWKDKYIDFLSSKKELKEKQFYIYSAAGKAFNFAFALTKFKNSDQMFSVDIARSKQGYFMEASGVRVLSVKEAKSEKSRSEVLFILNPAHEEFAISRFPNYEVLRGFQKYRS